MRVSYWVFEIVDGPRRGALLIGRYHDGPSDHGVGYGGSNWGVARASFGETSGASGWDNSCHETGPTPVYAGAVDDFQGFDHESDARRAWAAKPCEAKRVTPAVGDG